MPIRESDCKHDWLDITRLGEAGRAERCAKCGVERKTVDPKNGVLGPRGGLGGGR